MYKFSGLKTLIVALFALALAGCGVPLAAQQGGGLTTPTVASQTGHNNVVPSAPSLTVEITNFCNGQAQVDYGYAVQFCEGKLSLSSLPVSITTSIGSQASAAWCLANMWTNASGQLAVPKDGSGNPIVPTLGNCPTGAAPATVTAPSGAPAKS